MLLTSSRTPWLELEHAQGMGDVLERVVNAVGEVVRGVYAPLVSRLRLKGDVVVAQRVVKAGTKAQCVGMNHKCKEMKTQEGHTHNGMIVVGRMARQTVPVALGATSPNI